MKKIFLLLILFFCAQTTFAYELEGFCSTNNSSKNLIGNFSSISGLNFLTRNIIEHEITRIVKKETSSKIKVNLDNYYGISILQGKFKSLNATGKNFSYSGIFLSDLNIKTVCPYNHIGFKDNEIKFYENLALNFSTKITQEDLNKITNSQEYKTILNKMNSIKAISAFFEIKDSQITIENNKLNLKYTILPFSKNTLLSSLTKNIKPIKLSIGADLKVENGKVKLDNLNSKSNKYFDISTIINYLNPLTYEIKSNKQKQGEVKVQQVQIKNQEVYLEGLVFIPKNI